MKVLSYPFNVPLLDIYAYELRRTKVKKRQFNLHEKQRGGETNLGV